MEDNYMRITVYPQDLTKNEILILEHLAKYEENLEHKQRLVGNRFQIYYSIYEQLLLRMAVIHSIKTADMLDLFNKNERCLPRNKRSLQNFFDNVRYSNDILDINQLVYNLHIESLNKKDKDIMLNNIEKLCDTIISLVNNCKSAKLYTKHFSDDTLEELIAIDQGININNLSKKEPIKKIIKPTNDDNNSMVIAKEEISLGTKLTEVLDSFDSNISISRFLSIAKTKCCRFEIFAAIWGCTTEQAKNIIIEFRDKRGIPIFIEPDGQSFRIISSADRDDFTADKVTCINVPTFTLNNGIECTRLGIVSDTHFGSDQCDIENLERFYHIATSLGIKTFLHAGDWLDGDSVYRGQKYALSYTGFENQINQVQQYYPCYDGVDTYGIMGNHDNDYMKASGSNPLKLLSLLRKDIHYVGNFQAYLNINGFYVNLHHPGGGSNKTKPEITLRNIVDLKNQHMRQRNIPMIDLCVVGHYHTRAIIETETVRLAMFGGGFQKSTGLCKQFGLVPFEGGFIITMYKMPDGTHRIEQHGIPFRVY